MSMIAVKWAYSEEVLALELSASAHAVLVALAFVYYDGPEAKRPVPGKPDCFLGREELMRLTGLKRTNLDKGKAELKKKGLVAWIQGGLRGKEKLTNEYTLNCPELTAHLKRIRGTARKMPPKDPAATAAANERQAEATAAIENLPPKDLHLYGPNAAQIFRYLVTLAPDTNALRADFDFFIEKYGYGDNRTNVIEVDIGTPLKETYDRLLAKKRQPRVKAVKPVSNWGRYALGAFIRNNVIRVEDPPVSANHPLVLPEDDMPF